MIQEVELLSQGARFALQIHSAHICSIHILGERETAGQTPQPPGLSPPSESAQHPSEPENRPPPTRSPAHLLEQHKLILRCSALIDFILVPVIREDVGQAQPCSAF